MRIYSTVLKHLIIPKRNLKRSCFNSGGEEKSWCHYFHGDPIVNAITSSFWQTPLTSTDDAIYEQWTDPISIRVAALPKQSHPISQWRKGSWNVSSAEVDAASRKSDSWKMNLCVFVFGLALPHTPPADSLSRFLSSAVFTHHRLICQSLRPTCL